MKFENAFPVNLCENAAPSISLGLIRLRVERGKGVEGVVEFEADLFPH